MCYQMLYRNISDILFFYSVIQKKKKNKKKMSLSMNKLAVRNVGGRRNLKLIILTRNLRFLRKKILQKMECNKPILMITRTMKKIKV